MISGNRGRPRTYQQGTRRRQKLEGLTRKKNPALEKLKEKDSTPEKSEADSRKAPSSQFLDPKSFDIKEVPSLEYDSLPSEGKIGDWSKDFEFLEKARMRRFIATTVLAMCVGFILVCIIRFAFTGDDLQLAAPVLLSEPLSVVLKYYFG